MKSLEERYESMLKPRATATDMKAVIGEIEAEIDRLSASAEEARATSLDPAVSETDAQQARVDEESFRFAVERWAARLEVLEARYAERTESEAAQAQKREFEAAAQEAEALAREINERLPEVFAYLTDLLRRIRENDARVEVANLSKPGGAEHIIPAEQAARGYNGAGTWPNLMPVERLTSMVIPRLKGSGRLWPQEDAVAASSSPIISADASMKQWAREREASKRQYTVQRTDKRFGTLQLRHADGLFDLGTQEYTCWLHPDQVKACRDAGMKVQAVASARAAEPEIAR